MNITNAAGDEATGFAWVTELKKRGVGMWLLPMMTAHLIRSLPKCEDDITSDVELLIE